MLPSIAEFLLIFALVFATIQTTLVLFTKKLVVARIIAFGQFILIGSAFLILIICFINSDFSVALVANNSHITKPLIYKISGAWGNHEGSILMWVLILVMFNLLYACLSLNHERNLLTLSFHGFIIVLFLTYTILLSNPFSRLFPSPIMGLGLNPILQDIGLALHPPILYLGYVGFSITYAASLAGLINKVDGQIWAKKVLPFVTLSWCALTLGIGLGSWWAYRELGWGGFWFWDPVENASLIPWLSATALLHTLKVVSKTGQLKSWGFILSTLTFCLSCVGTFLVRSGSITSVHSFAADPSRGVAILLIVLILTILGLSIFIFRTKFIIDDKLNLKGRAYLIAINNVIFIFFTIVILTGTIYPLILDMLFNEKISVGSDYYNTLLAPTTICLLMLCIIAPRFNYKEFNFKTKKSLISIYLLSFMVCAIISYYLPIFKIIVMIIIWFSIALMLENMFALYKSIKFRTYNKFPMILAHLGFAMLAFSITINSVTQQEVEKILKINESLTISNYSIKLKSINYFKGPNYYARQATFEVWDNKTFLGYIKPQTNLYLVENQQTAESGILHKLLYDLYITIGSTNDNLDIVAIVHFKPLMAFIGFGCLLIFISGITGIVNKALKN